MRPNGFIVAVSAVVVSQSTYLVHSQDSSPRDMTRLFVRKGDDIGIFHQQSKKSMLKYLQGRSGGSTEPVFDRKGDDFDILLSLINLVPGLVRRLDDGGFKDVTLFAPRDYAFYRLAKDLGYESGDSGSKPDEEQVFSFLLKRLNEYANRNDVTTEQIIGDILRNHIGDTSMTEDELRRSGSFATYSDFIIQVLKARSVRRNKKRTKLVSVGSKAVIHPRRKNIRTKNGYIHVVKDVLLPVDDFDPESITSAADGDEDEDEGKIPTTSPTEDRHGCARTTYRGFECEGGIISAIKVASSITTCREHCADAALCVALMFDISRGSCYLYDVQPEDIGDRDENVVCELVGETCEADESVHDKPPRDSVAPTSSYLYLGPPTAAPTDPSFILDPERRYQEFCDRRGGTMVENGQVCQVCPGDNGGQGCCISTMTDPDEWQCDACVLIDDSVECNLIQCDNVGGGFFCNDCASYSLGDICVGYYYSNGLFRCREFALNGQDCGECFVDAEDGIIIRFEGCNYDESFSPRPSPLTPQRTAIPTPLPSSTMSPTSTKLPSSCSPTTGPCVSSEAMFQSIARGLAPNDTVAVCGRRMDGDFSFEVDSSTIIDQHNITICCAGPELCRIKAITRQGSGLADDRILVVTGQNFTVIGIEFWFGVGGRVLQRLTGNTRDAEAGGGNLVILAEGDHLISNCFFGGGYAERPLDDDPSDFYRGIGGNVFVRTSGKVMIRQSTFERGIAQIGGGMAIDAPHIVLEDSALRGNLNTGLYTYLAGELRSNPITRLSQTIEISRTTFLGNRGDFGGGLLATAIGALPSLSITRSIFEENVALDGAAGALFPDEGIFSSLQLQGNKGVGNTIADPSMSSQDCTELLVSTEEGYKCIDVHQEVVDTWPDGDETSCPSECRDCLVEVSNDWLTFCLQGDGGCGRDEDAAYLYSGDGYKIRENRCDIMYFSGGWCTQLAITTKEQEACVKEWQPVVDRYINVAGQSGSCKDAIAIDI